MGVFGVLHTPNTPTDAYNHGNSQKPKAFHMISFVTFVSPFVFFVLKQELNNPVCASFDVDNQRFFW